MSKRAEATRPRIAMSAYPVTSGFLTVVSAFISLIFGAILLLSNIAAASAVSYGFTALYYSPPILAVGVMSMVGFVFGLPAGILALKRRSLLRVVIGVVLLMATAISYFFLSPVQNWVFGGVIVLFSVLSIILATVARKEFS